ncbi:phosphoglycerate kinase [Granulicatella adiacens ATCC 49175]|uniref:Phosphoglycerate kinase n=2 Tax=Carnobacteriaceae TaxID=186828 RepID=C8NGI7_9LACT|nr:phosphoglycerate kinase [Granulicatella adiacens ATCC 49175]
MEAFASSPCFHNVSNALAPNKNVGGYFMAKKIVTDLQVEGKKVLVRVDFNVPLKDGVITDDNRIVQALPTIKYLVDHNAKVILFSHLGKVKSEEDKAKLSLRPVAERLSELLEKPVTFVPETRGEKLEAAINALNEGDVLLFENTRFEDLDGKKESKNDPELGKYWASLGDLFVNDAFGTAHRAHASNVGIASQLESAAGFLMEKEIKFIGGAVDNPERPFVAILGGAKVSDKIGVINSLLDKADKVLIGGGMAYTFFKAMGREVGLSLLELDRVELAKEIMEKAGDKLVLPIDNVVAKEFSNDAVATIVASDAIPADQEGLDIGPKTVELFASYLKDAKTVVWNGPMGVFELPNFAKGTIGVCEAIANLEGATTIIGGGDSAAAAISLGYADKFTHISTGGGASLEYLEGKELPGVAAISDK